VLPELNEQKYEPTCFIDVALAHVEGGTTDRIEVLRSDWIGPPR
jgi:hypothetical protein